MGLLHSSPPRPETLSPFWCTQHPGRFHGSWGSLLHLLCRPQKWWSQNKGVVYRKDKSSSRLLANQSPAFKLNICPAPICHHQASHTSQGQIWVTVWELGALAWKALQGTFSWAGEEVSPALADGRGLHLALGSMPVPDTSSGLSWVRE